MYFEYRCIYIYILRDVPLSTDNDDIEKDIRRAQNNISAKRLYKNGKQLYTMLLTFTSEKDNLEPLKREYTSFPVELCATAKD